MKPRWLLVAFFVLSLFGPASVLAADVQVQLLDNKGAMIGKTSVPQERLASYTQEQKAKGIVVKPISAVPPSSNMPPIPTTSGVSATQAVH